MTRQAFITQPKASWLYRLCMAPFHRYMGRENVHGWVWREEEEEKEESLCFEAAYHLCTEAWQQLGGSVSLIWRKKLSACFQHVANMMLRMKREFAGSQNQILPVFDTLLLLDRNVDLLTPLATQLTYEGLIDEIYGITNGQNKCFFFLTPPSMNECLNVSGFIFTAHPLSPSDLKVTSSCLLRSLRRRSKARRVKIYPQSPRSYSSTQQRSCTQKSGTKISTPSEQRSARRLK